MSFIRVAPLSTLALAALPLAAQDLTIVSRSTRNQDPPQVTTSYISSERIRMANADGSELLAEPASGKFTLIDNRKKEYSVVTKQDMEAAAAAMAAKMKEMEPQMKKAQEQMKSLPPEMQEKMKGMMGGGLTAAVTVTKGPGTRSIAGYKCENWTIAIGTISKTEQCLTTEVTYPPQVWDAYRDFASSFQSSLQSMGPMAQGMKDMQEKTKDMKGLPLATSNSVSIMGKSNVDTQEVTEIKRGPIPASAWQIPAGYKQVESPMAKMAKQAK